MSRLHVIKANNIFHPDDRHLLEKLNSMMSLDVLILKREKILTNKRAFRKIKKDNAQKNILAELAERLRNQFGNELKLRIVRKKDCHDYFLEKINFNE